MDDFREQVKKGFKKCKLDIEEISENNSNLTNKYSNLLDENKELKTKVNSLNDEITQLRSEMGSLVSVIDEIKRNNDNLQKSMQEIQTTQQTTTSEIQTISNNQNNIQQQDISTIEPANEIKTKKTKQIRTPREDPYEALLSFKAKAKKKDILKQKLISMVGDGINLSELKYLFVDHYKYSSKATFYNYLKEVEFEKSIKIERESSKNNVYLNNPILRDDLKDEI